MPANWFKKDALKNDPTVIVVPPGRGLGHWILVVAALAIIGWVYWTMAGRLIATTNLEPQRQDQKHNMRRALASRDVFNHPAPGESVTDGFVRLLPHQTDGVVAPLWPWIAAHFADDDHQIKERTFDIDNSQDLDFFKRGKWVNVWMTLGFLMLLGLFAARNFTILGTINLCLLAGFGALLPRAIYFQPEPLFYILFFLAWLCVLELLKKNSLWLHAIFGVICGLAYLAKTSIEPLILGWLALGIYRHVKACFVKHKDTQWSRGSHFIGLCCFAFAYFAVIGSTLAFNHKTFGSAFHNYPRYWMWMDDFDNVGMKWMQEHQTPESLANIPKDEKPTFSNYRRTHTGEQMWLRLADGTYAKMEQFLAPKREFKKPRDGWRRILDWRGWYLAWLVVLLAMAAAFVRSRGKAKIAENPPLHREAGPMTLFVVGTFAAYSLAFGWYHVIGRGERFMLGLYLPLAFSLLWAADSLYRWAERRSVLEWHRFAYGVAQLALTGAIVWRLVILWRDYGAKVWFDPDII